MTAVVCRIPFFIAAPVTTLDSNLASGADIVIEHRPGSEITHYNGQQVAAEGIQVTQALHIACCVRVLLIVSHIPASQCMQLACMWLSWP